MSIMLPAFFGGVVVVRKVGGIVRRVSFVYDEYQSGYIQKKLQNGKGRKKKKKRESQEKIE